MTEQNFQADVARLLDIVAHALYSNRDIFLRELISNASDACDKLRYLALQAQGSAAASPEIIIAINPKARTLTLQDTGLGMNAADLAENLGTIARSGTKAMLEAIKASGSSNAPPSLIGQFGVGFYSSFMVADNVSVSSKKWGEDGVNTWRSDGKTGYTITPEQNTDIIKKIGSHGTVITLNIKDDASDYLIPQKIIEIVKTYSNHISLPVYLLNDDGNKDRVNEAVALWTLPKNEVTAEQYKEFYNTVSGGMGYDDPILTSHWKAEGKIEYTALLFTPSLRPWDMYDPTRKNSLRLYVRRVFITDDCEGLVYPWLRFLRGVIDSEDLPLNISREMLQHNPVISRIRSGVAKKILGDMVKLAESDTVSFNALWAQYGAVLKEGLYDAGEHREDLLKIARFFTLNSGDKMLSLDEYVAGMKEGQQEIYYISGENVESLRRSPQIEGFKARGLDVIIMKDTIDEFWLPVVADYQGKKFTSVTKGAVDLDKFAKADDTEAEKVDETDYTALMAEMKKHLADKVSDVRISTRLTESPVCLVAADKEIDLHMEKVLKLHQQYEAKTKPVLEINPDHALIKILKDKAGSTANMGEYAELLLDQARIMQGEAVADPVAFARKISELMVKSLAA